MGGRCRGTLLLPVQGARLPRLLRRMRLGLQACGGAGAGGDDQQRP